jgi:hypothetical protein
MGAPTSEVGYTSASGHVVAWGGKIYSLMLTMRDLVLPSKRHMDKIQKYL